MTAIGSNQDLDFNDVKYRKFTALFALMQAARTISSDRVIHNNIDDYSYDYSYGILYKSIFIKNYDSVVELYGGDINNLKHVA